MRNQPTNPNIVPVHSLSFTNVMQDVFATQMLGPRLCFVMSATSQPFLPGVAYISIYANRGPYFGGGAPCHHAGKMDNGAAPLRLIVYSFSFFISFTVGVEQKAATLK